MDKSWKKMDKSLTIIGQSQARVGHKLDKSQTKGLEFNKMDENWTKMDTDDQELDTNEQEKDKNGQELDINGH